MEKEFFVLLADGRQFSVRASELRHSSFNGAGVTFMLGNDTACYVPSASLGAIVERGALIGEIETAAKDAAIPEFVAPKRRRTARVVRATNGNGKTARNGTKRRARR